MAKPVLYQFALCPFCNKVRAALDLKGIDYDMVEVSPRSKKELPELPEGTPKKVPVLKAGEDVIQDSTNILAYVEKNLPGKMSFRAEDEAVQKRAEEIEDWVDSQFIEALPTVLYADKKGAAQAAKIVADGTNLGFFGKMAVRHFGAKGMQKIPPRILERNGRTDGKAWVLENLDQFEDWLGDQQFILGDALNIADVAMQGAVTCVKPFPIFEEIMSRPTVAAWYQRVTAIRDENRAAAPSPA